MRKSNVMTYNEGKKLLKHITETATAFKLNLVLKQGLPNALLFIVPDECLEGEPTRVVSDSGILLGHLWFNISLVTRDDKKIFNFVLCPLRYIVDKEFKTLITRLKELATALGECPVTISNRSGTKQLMGNFRLDIFNDYAELMSSNFSGNVITDILLKSNYSETCVDCQYHINKIKYVKLSELVKSLPEEVVKKIEIANDNYERTDANFMKRFKCSAKAVAKK